MKKILLFGLLSVFSISSMNAQKKNVVKIRPLTLAIGMIDGTYERAIGAKSAVALNFSYVNYNVTDLVKSQMTFTGTLNKATIGGYMVTPQYKTYFKAEAPKGVYFTPFLQYGKYTVAQNNTDQFNITSGSSASVNIYGAGVGFGCQWLLGAFAIDWNFVGLGVQAWDLSFKYDLDNADNNKNATDIVANLEDLGFFPGFKISKPASGGIEIHGPISLVPTFRSNLSIGFAF